MLLKNARGPEIDAIDHGAQSVGSASRQRFRNPNLEKVQAPNPPLPVDRKYPVIYADPPWRFKGFSNAWSSRAASNHYSVMELADICSLPVANLAAPAAVLFLWTTAPFLQKAFDVLTAWGFNIPATLSGSRISAAPAIGAAVNMNIS
jgi:N6-adenosine-specific RNA methylase IME4